VSVHPDGSGTEWTLVETVDIDQPHGLDYRYGQHIAKGVRKRINKEHVAFGDTTAGGEHIPGGCAVLDVVDGTADLTGGWNDGTYTGGGLVHTTTKGLLWVCSTLDTTYDAVRDVTLVKLHPDLQWAGQDVTWAGAHEFDASVDISGNVAMDGDLTIDGNLIVDSSTTLASVDITGDLFVDSSADFSDVYIAGDLSMGGIIKGIDVTLSGDLAVDGTSNFTGDADFAGAVNFGGGIVGSYIASGATVFNASMTAAYTFQDLDLSGTVGSNVALVHLEVNFGSANVYAAKPKGYGGVFYAHYRNGFGIGGTVIETDGIVYPIYAYITVATDSSGVIQHGFTDSGSTITIKLIGYII